MVKYTQIKRFSTYTFSVTKKRVHIYILHHLNKKNASVFT